MAACAPWGRNAYRSMINPYSSLNVHGSARAARTDPIAAADTPFCASHASIANSMKPNGRPCAKYSKNSVIIRKLRRSVSANALAGSIGKAWVAIGEFSGRGDCCWQKCGRRRSPQKRAARHDPETGSLISEPIPDTGLCPVPRGHLAALGCGSGGASGSSAPSVHSSAHGGLRPAQLSDNR